MSSLDSDNVTSGDETLGRVARLASRLLSAPFVIVSLGEGESQSVQATFGLNEANVEELLDFIKKIAILKQPLIEQDVSNDPLLEGSTLLDGEQAIRFCAGMPLVSRDGCNLGALVVMDHAVRTLSDEEYSSLTDLAALALGEVELRRENRKLRNIEAETAQREREFRTMVENARDIITRTDRNLRYTFVSPSVEQATGHPPSFLIGKTNREIGMPAELIQYWETKKREMFATGEFTSIEFTQVVPDGSTRYFETRAIPELGDDGEVQSILSITRDVTARKEVELELEKQQAILQTIFEHIPVMIDFYSSDGQFHLVNPEWERVTGWSLEEVLNHRDITEELYPDAEYRRYAMEQMELAHGRWQEARTRVRDGSIRDILWKNVQLPDGTRIGFGQDITEQKKADQVLLQAKQEAERANKSKSEFLSRMSHELRTPLNAILGFGQLFDQEHLTARDQENVTQIVKAGRYLLALINEVLDVASIDAGHLTLSLEAVSVKEMIDEVIVLMRPLADERNISFIRFQNLIADDHYMRADRQRFHQILLNLVSNAVKYNREGGTVVFSAGIDNQLLRLNITDTGYGIAPQDQEKLFTPFERLDAERRGIAGSGIGLVLSKRLAEVMGGAIGVESTPDEGSTFFVSLPIEENPLKRLEKMGDVSEKNNRPKPKRSIIYIEDNLPNLKLVERILVHRPEFRLLAAMRGDLGLELVIENLPDLVLLDLHLPGMDGSEVLKYLKNDPRTSSIPVIVISADATPGQPQSLLEAGASHYLVKPLNVKQLLGIVDSIVREASSKTATEIGTSRTDKG